MKSIKQIVAEMKMRPNYWKELVKLQAQTIKNRNRDIKILKKALEYYAKTFQGGSAANRALKALKLTETSYEKFFKILLTNQLYVVDWNYENK